MTASRAVILLSILVGVCASDDDHVSLLQTRAELIPPSDLSLGALKRKLMEAGVHVPPNHMEHKREKLMRMLKEAQAGKAEWFTADSHAAVAAVPNLSDLSVGALKRELMEAGVQVPPHHMEHEKRELLRMLTEAQAGKADVEAVDYHDYVKETIFVRAADDDSHAAVAADGDSHAAVAADGDSYAAVAADEGLSHLSVGALKRKLMDAGVHVPPHHMEHEKRKLARMLTEAQTGVEQPPANTWAGQPSSAAKPSSEGKQGSQSLSRFGNEANQVESSKQGADANSQSESGGIVRLLDFTQATLVNNNLGGQGPQSGPEEIRYRNLVRGSKVDLVVTAGAGYVAHNPKRNGILDGNGQINAKSGTSASLTYTFVEEGTNTPHVMPRFYITFSDLDESHGGVEKERISVDSYERYYTNDDLDIVSNSDLGSSIPTFESSDYGSFADNDFSPDSPTPSQLSHAVTYLFLNKSGFNAIFSIESHARLQQGRNVLFSGISQLVFCQDPSTYLDLKNATVTVNNLGGHGPGPTSDAHELRWTGVATSAAGVSLDLVATADETYGYTPWNASQNGLHGDFGHINLYCGPTKTASEAYITFTVVESGTNTPVTLNQFAFVIFDFDSGLHEQQVEYVELVPTGTGFEGGSGYSSYIVTETTELSVTSQNSGNKRFSATKHGTEADNPTAAQNLARETADKSAVFTFRKTSSFTITMGITATGQNTGRNFMFSGQDMYLMCD